MKKFLLLTCIAASFLVVLYGCGNKNASRDSKIDSQVDQLLSQMTIEEKVGQMTQVTIDVVLATDSSNKVIEPQRIDTAKLRKAIVGYNVGSILNVAGNAYTREHWFEVISTIQKMAMEQTRIKIPVLYGIDAIHGVTYTEKSTLFPQQIGLAATWNTGLVEQAASIAAYETRASYIPWNFSPVLDLGRNAAWPRLWETFGEDVFLDKTMGKAMIQGYEGHDISDKFKVASCLKHYMGYSLPLSGKDRTPAWIPEIFLREYILPPFAEAVQAGAHSVMICSGEINGVPVHANHHILTDILRNELNFKGIAVSDWEDINRLYSNHHIAASPKEAVKIAVMAGVDMSMVPLDFKFYDYLLELVNEGEVPVSRIDEAVSRILRVKVELGLLEHPYYSTSDYPKFGSEEFRHASLEAARESVTLLKNEQGVLPLPKSAKVLVTGFAANSMRCLNGGWTYTWQGDRTDEFAKDKSTILEAIQKKVGNANVTYAEGTTYDSLTDNKRAVQLAHSSDYIVLCLGELSYTESPGNINDLYLPEAQVQFANQLAATGKPVILVLAEGRPRLISKFAQNMKGIFMAYLPGNEGGLAIADLLFGDVNPSGKLPFTYPRYPNDLSNYDRKYTEEAYSSSYNPQYPFGYGLSYTTFTYANLEIDKPMLDASEQVKITVDVTNTGKTRGKEVVQLYVSDLVASITPSVKRLRGFEKLELEAGQTKKVSFTIAASDIAFVNNDLKWVTEPGEFEVTIDKLHGKFTLR